MEDNKHKFNVRNFIKPENRLASFTISRDLSLGGTKPKRVYTPNLNAVRSKQKSGPRISSSPSVASLQSRRSNVQPVNSKVVNNGRYVQQSGVFSEGTANIKRPTIFSDKHATARETGTSSGMIKPKLGNSWNIDVKEEAGIVSDLLAYDEDSDSGNECEYQPVVLPLSANNGGFINTFQVKKEPLNYIKEEIDCEPLNGSRPSDYKSDLNYMYTPACFKNGKIYSDNNVAVSLIKFPDSLPGKGFDENDKIADYTIRQMVEGHIGKILIRKSGRMDVVIGKTAYTMDAVEAAQFKEELMCRAESNNESAFASLGVIDEKLVLAPVWTNLLQVNANCDQNKV